jgi:hypothetical protein
MMMINLTLFKRSSDSWIDEQIAKVRVSFQSELSAAKDDGEQSQL